MIRDNYIGYLNRQGYAATGYATREQALTAFNKRLPDLVIFDIGLANDIDGGFELCRELRNRSNTLPIIFLTARDSDFDSVSGFRLGADDYLTKDISLPHLIALSLYLMHLWGEQLRQNEIGIHFIVHYGLYITT